MSLLDLFKSSKPSRESSGLFVPNGHGGFKELIGAPENASINALSEHMGYRPDQTHYYFGDSDSNSEINGIIFELFSTNIVVISTKKTVTAIDPAKLRYFMRNITDWDLISSYNVKSSLEDGIANKSLPSNFLAKVLNMKGVERDGVFFSERVGLYLYFGDGVLTDFQSSDGLGHWAKHFKSINPNIIESFEREAKKHCGNDQKQILTEINLQCDSLAEIPKASNNEYIPLHTNNEGLTNYYMLMTTHYDKPMRVEDFIVNNVGRYAPMQHLGNEDNMVFKCGRFIYEFSGDGDLLKSYQE